MENETQSQEPESFDEWAERVAAEYDEVEPDRFACGGWRCAGAHVSQS